MLYCPFCNEPRFAARALWGHIMEQHAAECRAEASDYATREGFQLSVLAGQWVGEAIDEAKAGGETWK